MSPSSESSPDVSKPLVLLIVWIALNVAFVTIADPDSRRPDAQTDGISSMVLVQFNANPVRLEPKGEHEAGDVLPYRLLSPARLLSGRRYPLLVFLHGAGQRGSDNVQQLRGLPEQMAQPDWRARFPCYLYAPQCPDEMRWTQWMAQLEDAIEQLARRLPIDRCRIYLTGLSMGGFGSWELAARRPDLFAAVVPICGGGDPLWASKLVEVGIWAVHGNADTVVPVECSRKIVRAILDQGGRPQYTELEGAGHDSWTQTYGDPEGVLKWMFAQREQPLPTMSSEPPEGAHRWGSAGSR